MTITCDALNLTVRNRSNLAILIDSSTAGVHTIFLPDARTDSGLSRGGDNTDVRDWIERASISLY